jgi:hypothetical protein
MCMCAFGIFTFSPDFTRFLNYQRVHMLFGNLISKLKKKDDEVTFILVTRMSLMMFNVRLVCSSRKFWRLDTFVVLESAVPLFFFLDSSQQNKSRYVAGQAQKCQCCQSLFRQSNNFCIYLITYSV